MRPVGITLLGIYQLLRGGLWIAFGLALMLAGGLAARLASVAIEGNAFARLLANVGHLLAIVVLVGGLAHLLTGVGLLKMRNWARLLTVFLCAVGLIVLLPLILLVHGVPLAFGTIDAVSIFYLAMPTIRRAFHGTRPVLGAAA